MTHLENSILDNNPDIKPSLDGWYGVDFFIVTETIDKLLQLKIMFETASVQKFTHEIVTGKAINALDVHIDGTQTYYSTAVYQNPTIIQLST